MAKNFLSLPVEIRSMIFTQLFTALRVKYMPKLDASTRHGNRVQSARWYYGDDEFYMRGRAMDTAVLFVSQQTKSEAVPILLATARINITAAIDKWYGEVLLTSFREVSMPLIKHACLNLSGLEPWVSIEKLFKSLPSLQRLDFSISEEADYFFDADDFDDSKTPLSKVVTAIQSSWERLIGFECDDDMRHARALLQQWFNQKMAFKLVLHSWVCALNQDESDVDFEWVRAAFF
jgi:hypothetical protein